MSLVHTSIVQYSPPGPVLDDHGERSHPRVDLHVRLHHAGVLQREGVVDVQVASQLELGIPDLDDRDLGIGDADHPVHAICERRCSIFCPGFRERDWCDYLRSARTCASRQTRSRAFIFVVMQMSTVNEAAGQRG